MQTVLNGACLQCSLMGKMKVSFTDSDLLYKCVHSGRFDCIYKYSYITTAPTSRDRMGHDRILVGFTTICAISVYHQ